MRSCQLGFGCSLVCVLPLELPREALFFLSLFCCCDACGLLDLGPGYRVLLCQPGCLLSLRVRGVSLQGCLLSLRVRGVSLQGCLVSSHVQAVKPIPRFGGAFGRRGEGGLSVRWRVSEVRYFGVVRWPSVRW